MLQTILWIVLVFLLWCYSEQSSEMWPVNTWTVGFGFSSYHKKKKKQKADYAEDWVLIWNTIRYQATVFRYKHPLFFITILLRSKNCWQLRIVPIMAFVLVVTTSYLNFSNSGALLCFFFWCSLPVSVYNIICHFPAMAMAAPDPSSWELTSLWSGKMFSAEKIQV